MIGLSDTFITILQRYMYQKIRWFVFYLLVVSLLVANYLYAELETLYRVLAASLVVLVAVLIVWSTDRGIYLRKLFKDAQIEMKKVVWPTRPELLQTSMVVFVAVIIVAVLLWSLDSFFSWLISLLIG